MDKICSFTPSKEFANGFHTMVDNVINDCVSVIG